jgi:hypothetical protein
MWYQASCHSTWPRVRAHNLEFAGLFFPFTFLIAASAAQSLTNSGFSVSSRKMDVPSVIAFDGVDGALLACSSSASVAPKTVSANWSFYSRSAHLP